MDVHNNISLANYTTMRLGGAARFMTTATTPEEVKNIYDAAKSHGVPVFILGGGSNVVVSDQGYNGVVVLNRIKGIELVSEDASTVTFRIGAGEVLDEVVARFVSEGFSGVESLSGIPGTIGAAPVQNVGAYGQEIADTLISVEAYDSEQGKFITLTSEQLGFSYRHSILRGESIGRYCITYVTLRLFRAAPQSPFYKSLEQYFSEHGISFFTSDIVRQAVLEIRREKLPDPTERPNAGSFFKNAVIEEWQYRDMIKDYPDMPSFDMPGGRFKIPTGWLIEQAELKGELLHGMRVHDKNALVLINESASSYADLATARHEIIQRVYDVFSIQIEQEPLEI